MQENQSIQVGVRIPLMLERHIQKMAKQGYRTKSDELRMIIQRGFEAVYGYNPDTTTNINTTQETT